MSAELSMFILNVLADARLEWTHRQRFLSRPDLVWRRYSHVSLMSISFHSLTDGNCYDTSERSH